MAAVFDEARDIEELDSWKEFQGIVWPGIIGVDVVQ